MQMTPVKSSQVLGFGYDPTTLDLAVEFPNSGTYTYHGVSPEHFAGLQEAESIGRYLNQVIKPTYSGTRPDGSPFAPAAPKAKAAPAPKSEQLPLTAADATQPASTAKATNALPEADEPYTHEQLVADLRAAGVILAAYTPAEITDLKGLEWLGDALYDCTAELALLEEEYARKAEPLMLRQQALRRYFEPQARKITEQLVAAAGGRKSFDTPLPDGRKLRWSLTTQPARLELADRDAALAWAKENLPAAITPVPERVIPASEALAAPAVAEHWKAAGATADAVPPGFNLVPETQRFSYKPVAGKEA